MKGWFAGQQIEDRCVVCLNDEEEDLFGGYFEQSRADDGIGRVCPYSTVDQIGVPWGSRYDSDLALSVRGKHVRSRAKRTETRNRIL